MRCRLIAFCRLFTVMAAITATAAAQLPEGTGGIAGRYPGDKGITDHDSVVFVEMFENGDVDDLGERWHEVSNRNNDISFSTDVPEGSSAKHSMLITHVGGQGTGANLFRKLDENHDQLFARWYVKFDRDCAAIHHFGTHMGGYNPATRWPQPNAGIQPPGDKRFTTGIEPFGERWRWDFYTYWSEMRGSPPRGQHWGNTFVNQDNATVKRGRWICVEMMVRMNDVGTRNGEQAFWIDGALIRKDGQIASHVGGGFPRGSWTHDRWLPDPGGEPFEGFQWRTTEDLGINNIWTYLYITKAPRGHVSKVHFSNIVVATEYIGPITD